MTAQDELKAVLRSVVGPALRSHGYKGSGTTWSFTSADGDAAVVNVQSSHYSTAAEVRCVVNLAIIPSVWRDWQQARMPNVNFSAPKEHHGLWHDQLHAGGDLADAHGWWRVTDARTAELAGGDIVQQLDNLGLPTLERLLIRDELIFTVRQQANSSDNSAVWDRQLAVLLADQGPSAELTELLHELDTNPGARREEATRVLTNWARARAAVTRGTH